MRSLRNILTLALGLLSTGSLHAVEITDREGRTIEVEILTIETDRIEIEMTGGNQLWLDRARLSDASNAMITAKTEAEKNAFKAFNQHMGVPLFEDNNLWDDANARVAKRLGWPRESKTKTQSSFRLYPKPNYRLLESRPFSAALYGQDGTVERLSVVFANKGDFRFSEPPTEDEIDAMEAAIEDDAQKIEARLDTALGEAEQQTFGSGRGIRQLVKRWDWKGHAFLLASQDGEYVNLKIMPSARADDKGRAERISDARLRDLAQSNIVRRPNGDVLIGNIPMVDQGPKGYCVPATFERYLRFMQIPADMYLLAMAGQTQIGGGTSLSKIIDSIEGYLGSQNRSLKRMQTEIETREIKKFIDEGLPLIWALFSSREFNQFANKRTAQRRKTTDWEAWADQTKSQSREVELRKDLTTAHACMIIGYNLETGEIAVSDSWGPNYEERWVPAEQLQQISQGSVYIVDY